MNGACVWFSFFACVVIVDASQHGSNVMSVWAFQHVPECAIDHAFVATISSLHSESPKESACLSFFVVIVDRTVRQVCYTQSFGQNNSSAFMGYVRDLHGRIEQ